MKTSIINLKIQCDTEHGFQKLLNYIDEYESVFVSMGIEDLELKIFRDGYKVYGKTSKDPATIKKLNLGVGGYENSIFDDLEDSKLLLYFPERRKPILKLYIPCDTRRSSIDKAKFFVENMPNDYCFDIFRGSNFGLVKSVRCSDGFIIYSKPDDRIKFDDTGIITFPENTKFSMYDFEEKNFMTMDHFFEEIVLAHLGLIDKMELMKRKENRRKRSYAKEQ